MSVRWECERSQECERMYELQIRVPQDGGMHDAVCGAKRSGGGGIEVGGCGGGETRLTVVGR
jgi:hypothetical protein